MYDDSTVADASTGDKIADPDFDHVTPAKRTIYREVEQGPVAQTSVLIAPKTYGPNLLGLQRQFGAKHAALVPGAQLLESGIQRRMSHRSPPSRRVVLKGT
ncbi:hypothetical protein [Sphingomonas sp. HMP9]|uniref:hypothetical protein n=1 Tax=Sphingomonas sp. HMP9 TaxID=1517554 RepID=UPI001596E49C